MARYKLMMSAFDRFWLVVDSHSDEVVTKFVTKSNAESECVRLNAETQAVEQAGNTQCPRCRGTGGGQYNDCPVCDGNGVV